MDNLEVVNAQTILSLLPGRLLGKLEPGGLAGTFYFNQDRTHTVVVYQYLTRLYVGVATKSKTDKFDALVGLRIAAVRCLRSAVLLPEAKRLKRRNGHG